MFSDLDQILKMRKTPDVPEGLSARIVAAAAHRSQNLGLDDDAYGLAAFWTDIQSMFKIPAPAFAFGVFVLFMLGMVVGSSADLINVLPGITQDQLAGFMFIDDGFVVGEWV